MTDETVDCFNCGRANPAWAQVCRSCGVPLRHGEARVAPTGRIRVNGVEAQPRDGVAITGEAEIVVEAIEDAEVVLVDAR